MRNLANTLVAAALLTAAAPAQADLPSVKSGARPGPDVLYAPAPRAPQLENTGPWKAEPILVSGASAYRQGEFLYQDWIYDDRGAVGEADPQDPTGSRNHLFSPKAGTVTYPTDPVYANNAADLVELRVKPVAGATAFRVTLNSLQDPERTAFTIAIGGADGEKVRWPYDANVVSPAELFLTVHGTTAELTDKAGKRVANPALTAKVDLERRQVEVLVPHAAWNPGTGKVRLAAGVGLWSSITNAYQRPSVGPATNSTPGGGPEDGTALFNVAFRAAEPLPKMEPNTGRTIGDAAATAKVQAHWWRERAQADALTKGDISEFFAVVDFGKLAAGATDESGVPKTGHMNRILASRFSFGQGQDYTRACGGIQATSKHRCDGQFVGQLQPYAVYVPKKPQPAGGYGLTLLLHALSANHNQYLGSRHAEQLGERDAGSVVITPSGRGPDGFYYDVAEADTFETWADIARVHDIDPDWVAISGYSMGGIGTWRLGGRWPDLFARAAPVVAGAVTSNNMIFLPSFRNIPVMTWSASFDELQTARDTEATTARLRELGLRFVADRFNTWDHLTPSTYDYYQPMADFLGGHRVARDPSHVTYVLDPQRDNPARSVVADHAYWLSGLKVRDAAAGPATIDVRSLGFGEPEPKAAPKPDEDGVLEGGNHEPAPYTRRQQDWEPGAAAPKADRLVVTATNIAAATVDAQRARISCSPSIELKADKPLTLDIACPPPPAPKKGTRAAGCTKTIAIRLPRVKGKRVTSAVVKRGKRTVLRKRGRNLRTLRVKRATKKAHTLRIVLRTSKRGRITVTRRIAACR
jgi:hypothetical protein